MFTHTPLQMLISSLSAPSSSHPAPAAQKAAHIQKSAQRTLANPDLQLVGVVQQPLPNKQHRDTHQPSAPLRIPISSLSASSSSRCMPSRPCRAAAEGQQCTRMAGISRRGKLSQSGPRRARRPSITKLQGSFKLRCLASPGGPMAASARCRHLLQRSRRSTRSA